MATAASSGRDPVLAQHRRELEDRRARIRAYREDLQQLVRFKQKVCKAVAGDHDLLLLCTPVSDMHNVALPSVIPTIKQMFNSIRCSVYTNAVKFGVYAHPPCAVCAFEISGGGGLLRIRTNYSKCTPMYHFCVQKTCICSLVYSARFGMCVRRHL